MHDRRTTAPLAWLTHPVTAVALVVLLLNDHVLKHAYGTWWTGKLSDVAWLVVAPPLLATALAAAARATRRPVAPRTLVRLAPACVGAAFVLVKTTTTGAALASAALTAVAGPSVVLRDPTDLLALPALALAAVTGARTHAVARRPGPPRPTGWWLVALPVAVLATTATSQAGPPRVDGVAVVDVGGDPALVAYEWGSALGATRDGRTWDVVLPERLQRATPTPDPTDAAAQPPTDAAAQPPADSWAQPPTDACVVHDPLVCYRPAGAGGLGVERSEDGGRTWATEWHVPDDVAERLRDRYSEDVHLRTADVAVLPTAAGHVVVAADAGDGLAVRHEDGTWERVGFAYLDSPPPVVPLPGEPTAWDHALPWGVVLGLVAGLLVLVSRRRRRPRSPSPAGGRRLAWAVVLVGGLAAVNAGTSSVRGQGVGTDVVLAVGGRALMVGVAAVAVALLVGAADDDAAIGPVLVAVAGVPAAVELLRPAPLAALVAVTVVAVAVAAVRTLPAASGEPPSGPGPSEGRSRVAP